MLPITVNYLNSKLSNWITFSSLIFLICLRQNRNSIFLKCMCMKRNSIFFTHASFCRNTIGEYSSLYWKTEWYGWNSPLFRPVSRGDVGNTTQELYWVPYQSTVSVDRESPFSRRTCQMIVIPQQRMWDVYLSIYYLTIKYRFSERFLFSFFFKKQNFALYFERMKYDVKYI